MIRVIKKDGTTEVYNPTKIIKAINRSSERVLRRFSKEEIDEVIDNIEQYLKQNKITEISVIDMHNVVEIALDKVNVEVAKSYREYRNYKKDFVSMLDEVYQKAQTIMYLGDKDNSNTDSSLVTTKRSLIYSELNKELYNKFFLNGDERQACKDGYIYIHDKSARRDTMNCCLYDTKNVMNGGFEMGNLWYNEPKTIDTACDVFGDIIMMSASMQYGGWSSRVDDLLAPYVEKSYIKYKEELLSYGLKEDVADSKALKKAEYDLKQGLQGLEYKLNSVASSRGDYPFTTFALGLGSNKFEQMVSKAALEVRMAGQGKEGYKRPVLFPKLIFLYDENLHGEGKELSHLFDLAVECSSKAMYPDFLSLTGEGYVPEMYKKYKKVVYPMGCVDGNEVITYKFNDNLYVQSFERMWNHLSKEFTIKEQESKGNYFINLKGVFIYDKKNGFVEVKSIIKNKDKGDWIRIVSSNGRSLLATSDHPLPTKRGRIDIGDVQLGDIIEINQNQYSEDKIQFSEDKAWLLGFILCDGCYDNQLNVSIAAKTEDDIEKKYSELMKKVYNLDTVTKLWERGKKGTYKEIKAYGDSKDKIQKELLSLFSGKQKKFRQIPNEVFSWGENSKYSFLAGMIDADGYINSSKGRSSKVQIGSTNKELALQQMALAQSLGMPSNLYLNKYNKGSSNIRYRVEFFINNKLKQKLSCQKKIEHSCKINEAVSKNEGVITSIEHLGFLDKFSYDVTTVSDKFDVSGIYSHNCRAFLSPWYIRGGMNPADDKDEPVFTGRFNLGAVTLNMIMIYAKAKEESKDFYEVLDYYLEMIRKIHKKTYNYLSEMRASTNPLGYCEGGFYGGNLKPNEKIGKILKPMTMSFGITGLNELQQLHNNKSISEDGNFVLEVMQYINDKIVEYKKEDQILYAVYGTPAESLCGLQISQFRDKYGLIKGVSDKSYTSNSFHCHVSEDIKPTEKQDLEYRFWNLFNGGKIQYVRYPIGYNIEAIKSLVRRAMKLGLYEGVNMALSYCDDCGHQEENMDICPKCNSKNLTKIDRMNGYLSYSRVKGDTRLNKAKMEEIQDRVSM